MIKENLMNSKVLVIPEGWEIEKIIDNRIILRESDGIGRLKTWEECCKVLGKGEVLRSDSNIMKNVSLSNPWDTTRSTLPEGFGCKVLALCQLLVCRNAWWKQLGWEPDWKNGIKKYCITCIGGEISNQSVYQSASILVFPTEEARNQFFESFRDLIEEAKELI